MAQGLADRILVWSYIDTGAYTQESCESYGPESFGHIHFAVAELIKNQLNELYAEFSEWFNLAEFPDVEERLETSEKAVFLKAAGAPDNWVPDPDNAGSIGNHDSFSGLCAVIDHRLDQRSLEQLKEAVDLFNWTIEAGLFCCDTPVQAVIRVGTVVDVAPFLLERILDRLPADKKSQDESNGFDRRFVPLARVMTILKETLESPGWVENELALKLFSYVAALYRDAVQED